MEPPLIGSKISLISMNEIRYEGTLHDINKVDTTIALKDVLSFGTEDRVADKSKFIPPNDSKYPYIKFRGSDIKDLHVHKPSDVIAQSQDEITFGSVSSVNVQQPPQQQQVKQQKKQTQAPKPQPNNQPKGQNQPKGRNNTTNNAAPVKPAGGNQPRGKGAKGALPGTGEALAHRRVRGATNVPGEDVSEDFDFFEATSSFNKEADKAKAFADSEVIPIKKYNPSSFFDDLSSDTSRSRTNVQDERKKNSETFGATSLQDNSRRRYNNSSNNNSNNQNNRKSGKGSYSNTNTPNTNNRGGSSFASTASNGTRPPTQPAPPSRPATAAQALARGLPQQPRVTPPPPPGIRPTTVASGGESKPSSTPNPDEFQQVKRKNNRNRNKNTDSSDKTTDKNKSSNNKNGRSGKGGKGNNRTNYQPRS